MLYLRARSLNHQLQLLFKLRVEVYLSYTFLTANITRWPFSRTYANFYYKKVMLRGRRVVNIRRYCAGCGLLYGKRTRKERTNTVQLRVPEGHLFRNAIANNMGYHYVSLWLIKVLWRCSIGLFQFEWQINSFAPVASLCSHRRINRRSFVLHFFLLPLLLTCLAQSSFILTSLIPCSRVLIQKFILAQVVKKIFHSPFFLWNLEGQYRVHKSQRLSISWTRWIQSSQSHSIFFL
jgi:hypothetical protein